jgi:pimeloyl-ACP methyl ester carboxylesterase
MKETVLLIPGLLCDRSLWRHQLEYMGRDYVLKVADLSIGNSIEEFAENAMALVPDGAFNIAGLSMGGYVALEIYKHAPERVSRLALLNASPYADLAEHAQYRRSSMELAKEHGLGDVVDSLLGRLIHPSRYQEEELVKTIDAMAHRVGVDGFIRQQTALLNRQDYTSTLRTVSCPSLILVGQQDALTPPKISREMAQQIPASKLVEIESCAHLSTLEQPEAVTALLRYWLQDE